MIENGSIRWNNAFPDEAKFSLQISILDDRMEHFVSKFGILAWYLTARNLSLFFEKELIRENHTILTLVFGNIFLFCQLSIYSLCYLIWQITKVTISFQPFFAFYDIGQGKVDMSTGPPRPPSASKRLMITAIVASSLSSLDMGLTENPPLQTLWWDPKFEPPPGLELCLWPL